ncbi:protein D3-like [Atheta coriaria]|uniref:protein D3-like n=1 Tax=Dalotia coriaria TaxID=877792 RepID=UPI0031F37841
MSEIPPETLKVFYKEFNKKVDLGNILTPTQVRKEPELSWTAKDGQYYTVLMVDPDAPSRADPKLGQWRHWLVGNVLGNDISKGDVLTAYVGAGPPRKTSLHRYIFMIYEQSKHIAFDEVVVPNTSTNTRPNFCARRFADKYSLGSPVAANFFQAKYDDYVPTLYKQLKD